jgi:hypothetical protein
VNRVWTPGQAIALDFQVSDGLPRWNGPQGASLGSCHWATSTGSATCLVGCPLLSLSTTGSTSRVYPVSTLVVSGKRPVNETLVRRGGKWPTHTNWVLSESLTQSMCCDHLSHSAQEGTWSYWGLVYSDFLAQERYTRLIFSHVSKHPRCPHGRRAHWVRVETTLQPDPSRGRRKCLTLFTKAGEPTNAKNHLSPHPGQWACRRPAPLSSTVLVIKWPQEDQFAFL